MNPQIIHLDIECTNPDCKSYNYFEDETGYYICSECNTISQIRCGAELDYYFPMRTMKSKIRNNEDDEEIISDDGNINDNNDFELFSQKYSSDAETLMNISTTNIKSSRFETSTFNDISSIYSRSTRKKIIREEKTPQQKLIEIQENFINVIKIIIGDFFENKNNIDNSKFLFYNKIIKFDENTKKEFFEIIRRFWMNFLLIKYKNMLSYNTKRKKLIRSRFNSINEEKEKEIRLNKEKDRENDNIIINNKNKINKNFIKKKN